ncbi:MAG: hypothetical protein AAB610_02385 [Patescibacteria group bacterium]
MKKVEKEKAIKLRGLGYSLGEISKKLGISKSTVSLWTKHVLLDVKAKNRIETLAKASRSRGHDILHKKKLDRLILAEKEANKLLEKIIIDKNTAIIALTMMYRCEGLKKDNGIAFTNSDPELIKAFIRMLGEVFKIDKKRFQVCLHLHDYHDKSESLDLWSDAINLPRGQFSVYMKKSEHKYSHEGYKGCARISYFDSHLSRVILSFAKNFIRLYI